MKFTSIIAATVLAQQAIAHPGQSREEHAQEARELNEYLSTHKRSLAHCADQLKARGNDVAMHARRTAMIEDLRKKRSIGQDAPFLRARDLDDALSKNHKSNLTGVTPDTDPSILFAGNNSCVLTPETTEGPYWVSGELIRSDITEGQAGVPLTVDIQVIDVNTCEPVPQSYLEIWSCNSTGVYSGVSAGGNGNSQGDTSNLNATWLRGVQATDDQGVVAFDTLVPGHYTGRATHIHVLSHVDATLQSNNTLTGGAITHVGQMFFDQDLVSLVEATEAYLPNQQELTLNEDDGILAGQAEGYDPMVEYVLLGDDITEGIFAWIAFGMDTTAVRDVNAAVIWTENGGVVNPDAPGPPSGPPPSV